MGYSSASLFVLAFLFSNPPEPILRERVDVVELNHFYDDNGKLRLDQIIFYQWSPITGRLAVRDFKPMTDPSLLPLRNGLRKGHVVIWHDDNLLRSVHAREIRETWTQFDPEMHERKFLPKDQRRALPRMVDQRPDAIRRKR